MNFSNLIEVGGREDRRKATVATTNSVISGPNPVLREASPRRGSTHGIPVRLSGPSVDSTNPVDLALRDFSKSSPRAIL